MRQAAPVSITSNADSRTQKACAKGCGRENLALPRSQQNEFGVELENARWIEAGEILHAGDVGRRPDLRGADDDGAAINVVIDAKLTVPVATDEIGGGAGVLGETHGLKILKMTPPRSSPLFPPDPGSALLRRRSRLLEQLLARADSCTRVADWRADAFRIIAPPAAAMPGVAAAALFADQGIVAGASVLMATPVHYLAEMNNVRLPADGILSLHPAEAGELAGDFNRVWHDAGIRLLSGRGAALYCVADQPLQAATHDPEDILDRHIDSHLPAGPDAPRLRRLMSEIEMWLFEHAVNRRRSAAAAPTVSGLWLWGGGPVAGSLPPLAGWMHGRRSVFRSIRLAAGSAERTRGSL